MANSKIGRYFSYSSGTDCDGVEIPTVVTAHMSKDEAYIYARENTDEGKLEYVAPINIIFNICQTQDIDFVEAIKL